MKNQIKFKEYNLSEHVLENYSESEIALMIGGHLSEEAPTVNVGGIAGTGDTRLAPDQREPGVYPEKTKYKKKNKKDTAILMKMLRRKINEKNIVEETETFAGNKVFIVPSTLFNDMRNQKRKGKHWKKYIPDDESSMSIRTYANKNPKKPVIIKCKNTGAMMYARYPKAN